jgi:tripartite ATP-independent transporter DctP family solute receptor
MMMLKKFRCLALVLALALVSCTTFAAKKPIKLVYGSVHYADTYLSRGDVYFKKLVEKKSKGQIIIDFFPGCQLGTQREMIQATRTNAQQMTIVTPGVFSTIWKKITALDLPYVFRDTAHLLKVTKSINSLIDPDEMAAKTGLRILNARIRAARNLTTNFPVNKLKDIEGIKMRVGESALSLALWKAMGCVPTVIPGSEMYTALATGVVVAQENPLEVLYTYKLYEVQKYCALTEHIREIQMVVINDKCWKDLTKAQQKILIYAATKSAKMGNADAQKEEKKYYDLLVEKGMKFTRPDVAPFRKSAKTIWDKFGDKKFIEKVEAIK